MHVIDILADRNPHAALSMDHPQGKLLYKFDMSLMERLSHAGMSMSRLNVQRRMRPTIADLIRYGATDSLFSCSLTLADLCSTRDSRTTTRSRTIPILLVSRR